jgi:hypothetical protein
MEKSIFTSSMLPPPPEVDPFLPMKLNDDLIFNIAKRYCRMERFFELNPDMHNIVLQAKVDNFKVYEQL